jgi:hypothetical protein
MAQKKFKYSIDISSIPKSIPIGGVENEINGVFIFWKPRSLFCKCGQQFRAEERKEDRPDWNGFTCPSCNHTFTSDDILFVGWRGAVFTEYSYHHDAVLAKQYAYKRASDESNIITLTKTPLEEEVEWFRLDNIKLLSLPIEVLKVVVSRYDNQLNPKMKTVIELRINENLSLPRFINTGNGGLGFINFVCDVLEKNPSVLREAIDDVGGYDGSDRFQSVQTYEKYEKYYPEYFRPLTPKIIKEGRMFYKGCASYCRSEMDGLPPYVELGEKQGLELVVSYYQSGLISYDQFKNLMKFKKVFANPNFTRVFKSAYMQMDSFCYDLTQDKIDLRYHDLDIRNYYMEKNTTPFIDFGYTQEQVYDAMNNSGGDWLGFLITIGSTRRSKVAKNN